MKDKMSVICFILNMFSLVKQSILRQYHGCLSLCSIVISHIYLSSFCYLSY